LRIGSFVHHRIVPEVKRVESVSNRMSYIVLRGRWYNTTVLNVYAPGKEESDYSKDSFYEEYNRFSIIFLNTTGTFCWRF